MINFDFVLPVPTATWQIILVMIGFTIGDWFSQIDYIIQQGQGFITKSEIDKKIIKAFFDVFHHWQIGAILFFLPGLGSLTFPFLKITIDFGAPIFDALMWIGVGIWGHDWKDWKHVLDRYKKSITSEDDSEDPEKLP